MKNFQRVLMFAIILLIGGCEDLFETNIEAEFPIDLTGYQLVIYNTDIRSNPDGLNVSDRTVYWFQSPTSVYGEGTDNSGPLPVDSWTWEYPTDEANDTRDVAWLKLDYGSSGTEFYGFFWYYDQKDLERRQTFGYTGNLGNFATVSTSGHFEIEKR